MAVIEHKEEECFTSKDSLRSQPLGTEQVQLEELGSVKISEIFPKMLQQAENFKLDFKRQCDLV